MPYLHPQAGKINFAGYWVVKAILLGWSIFSANSLRSSNVLFQAMNALSIQSFLGSRRGLAWKVRGEETIT